MTCPRPRVERRVGAVTRETALGRIVGRNAPSHGPEPTFALPLSPVIFEAGKM